MASVTDRSRTGCDEASITTAMTIAGTNQATNMPGSTMEPGKLSHPATQPPNLHHNHADMVDESTPMQNETAISTTLA